MAGFFDGEGSISIVKSHAERRLPSYTLHVYIGSVNKDALETFADLFGGVVKACKTSAHLHRQQMFGWNVGEWRALRFLNTLKPFLRVKLRQVGLAETFLETKKPELRQSLAITDEIIARREECYRKMSELNQSHWARKRTEGFTIKPKPVPVDKETLEHLYVKEQMSARAIAECLGYAVNHSTITYWLRHHGIPVRHGSERLQQSWIARRTKRIRGAP